MPDLPISIGISSITNLLFHQKNDTHNLANTLTLGFQAKLLHSTAESSSTSSGQVYTYPTPQRTVRRRESGDVRPTHSPFDVSISDSSVFFVLGSEEPSFTRNGHFKINTEGQLVTYNNIPVLGEDGPVFLLPEEIEGLSITSNGTLITKDGIVRGKLQLVRLDLDFTTDLGNTQVTTNEEIIPIAADDSSVTVTQGTLEQSNVQQTLVLTQLTETAHQLQTSQQMIKMYSDALNEMPDQLILLKTGA